MSDNRTALSIKYYHVLLIKPLFKQSFLLISKKTKQQLDPRKNSIGLRKLKK